MGHRMLPIAFFPTDPRCHGNEIWDKIGYNSFRVRDFCAYNGFFGDGPLNAANCIGNEIWDKIGLTRFV